MGVSEESNTFMGMVKMSKINKCRHEDVKCLNQYELIRKYLCCKCKKVMMCACDAEFGTKFVKEQLRVGVCLETQARA